MLLKPITILLVTYLGLSLICQSMSFPSGQNRMPRSVSDFTTNVVEELEGKFVSGTNITKKSIKLLKKKFEEFDELIKEADMNIHVIQEDIATLAAQNLRFTKDFLTDYHAAKEEVRIIRQDLRKLAVKTVSACNKMKKLIENWDEKENVFIKQQFKIMRQLLEESLKTLENAKIRYNKAITSINKATEQLRQFSDKVYNMTDVNTQEYESWTSAVRAAAYTGAGSVHVGLIVADVFGCLGICSTVGGAATWGATAAIVESKIEEYSLALQALEDIGDRVKININDFNTEMNDAKAILIEEIRLITDWEVAAENVNNNIDSFSIEDLKAVAVFQVIFVDDVNSLKKTAEDYLNFTKFSAKKE